MNQNPQSSEGRGDDDAALSDFLASLMDYTPTVTFFYLCSSKFPFSQFNHCPFFCLDTWWIGGALFGQERFSVSWRSIVGSSYLHSLSIFLSFISHKIRVNGFRFRQSFLFFVRKRVIDYHGFCWVSLAFCGSYWNILYLFLIHSTLAFLVHILWAWLETLIIFSGLDW